MSEVDAGAVAEEAASDDVKRKAEERERKKAEVRKRLEESGKLGKKAKKGFLTPERKKKLRKLLMIKAAEDLKQQGLKREQERQKVLSSRIPSIPDIDNVNDKGQLEKIYNDLFAKMIQLEEEKYDINYIVSTKDSELHTSSEVQINELTIAVNDLRGKFVKPTLKKVSKYDNKFKKLVEGGGDKGPKKDFRAQLKVVKKENLLDEALSKTKKAEKPEWSKKGPGGAEAPVSPPKRGSVASVASVGKSAAEQPEQPPVAEEPEEEEEEEEGLLGRGRRSSPSEDFELSEEEQGEEE